MLRIACCLLILLGGPVAVADEDLPFTVGYETTRITEPLLPNGAPDYVEAINQLAGEVRLPENNAAIPLLRIVGPEGIRNALLDEEQAEARRERLLEALGLALPPGGDYLPSQCWPEGIDRQETQRQRDLPTRAPWRPEDAPKLAARIEAHGRHLNRAIKASQRPGFHIPVLPARRRATPDAAGLSGEPCTFRPGSGSGHV